MKRPIVQNFRGARALVMHAMDHNGQSLVSTLRRLGLFVGVFDPGAGGPVPAGLAKDCDILIYDADLGMGPVFEDGVAPDVPTVAVIGVEAPSRLVRIVRQRSAAYLLKPVRSTGVFTALFIAVNEHGMRRAEQQALASAQARLHGRRYVTKAILALMQREGVDDDTAFRELRKESMKRRITVEALCRELVLSEDEAKERVRTAPV